MNWFKFTKSSLVFASRIVLGSLIVWWVPIISTTPGNYGVYHGYHRFRIGFRQDPHDRIRTGRQLYHGLRTGVVVHLISAA